MSDKPRFNVVVDALASIGMIAVCVLIVCLLLFRSPHKTAASKSAIAAPPVPGSALKIDRAHTKGDDKAQVALIEFSDFQCPYCADFAQQTFGPLVKKYVEPGKLLFVFHHYPLTAIHPLAEKAAESAECAARQGVFWGMHDLLFRNQKRLELASMKEWARELGLNAQRFSTCLDGEAATQVRSEGDEARALSVNGTPTFFLGTVLPDRTVKVTLRLDGGVGIAQLEEVIDRILEKH